jgi:hypothetical protein
MDWDRYKTLCDTPDVCSRWLLEQTLELLDAPALAQRLREGMSSGPLPKPDDHEGGSETDMFQMSLSLPEVRAVSQRVEDAMAAGVTTSGTRERGLGGFVETWREYQRYLERCATGDGS